MLSRDALLLFASVVGSGVAGFCTKQALRRGHPSSVQIAGAVIAPVLFLVMVLPFALWLKNQARAVGPSNAVWAWIALAGLTGLPAGLAGLYTLGRLPAAIAVPATATAPLVTVGLCVAFMDERLTRIQAVGVVMIVAGLVCLGWSER